MGSKEIRKGLVREYGNREFAGRNWMMGIIRGQWINPKKLERAKEFRRDMTETEKILWDNLRGNKLNGLHFRRQQVISGYITDFYCHSARLIVEIDGPVHDSQKEEDQMREIVLKNKGLKIFRVKNEEVQTNLPDVLDRISRACGK
jgi:very-short-patch-repair endonuclease